MKYLSLKFALFVVLFFAPVVMSSCDCPPFGRCGCDCDKQPKTYYDIQNVYGNILLGKGVFQTSTAYKFDSLQISIASQVSYPTVLRLPQMKGGASLLATPPCDCWEKYGANGAKEKVRFLTIKSQKDYATNFPKGTDLAPLMSIIDNYEGMFDIYPRYYTNVLNQKKKLIDFINSNPATPLSFNLLFDLPPSIDKKHIFTICYELDNGEVYTYNTPEITFQ